MEPAELRAARALIAARLEIGDPIPQAIFCRWLKCSPRSLAYYEAGERSIPDQVARRARQLRDNPEKCPRRDLEELRGRRERQRRRNASYWQRREKKAADRAAGRLAERIRAAKDYAAQLDQEEAAARLEETRKKIARLKASSDNGLAAPEP